MTPSVAYRLRRLSWLRQHGATHAARVYAANVLTVYRCRRRLGDSPIEAIVRAGLAARALLPAVEQAF